MYLFISVVLCLFTIILAGAFGYFLAWVERDHYSFPVYNCENQRVGYILKKPILYLGTGQEYNKIEVFDKKKFIEKLGL